MRSGRLNRRIQIQSRSTAVDGWYDAQSADFETVATVWASVRPTYGAEKYETAVDVAKVAFEVWYRYRAFPTVTEAHRIQYTEDADASIVRTLDIEAVLPHRDREMMRLICSEGEHLIAEVTQRMTSGDGYRVTTDGDIRIAA